MKFGDILRSLINDRNITQKQLASDLNIAPSTLGNYIQDSREPDFQTLKDIANYFNVTVDYLIDNRSPYTQSRNEEEILRIYRSLSPEQQDLYLEQGKAFLKINAKESAKSSKSTSQSGGKVG
ncbi:MAG: helix-turn-helix transcriptional regulator [Clostridiales bacterium]|nr:helix-turn-helix transcriptional regulator [Clostridiales bacterium]